MQTATYFKARWHGPNAKQVGLEKDFEAWMVRRFVCLEKKCIVGYKSPGGLRMVLLTVFKNFH